MGRQNPVRRLIDGFARAVRSDPAKRPMTQALPIIDDALAQRIIDLAMRIAAVMLSVGASAKEVALATTRITRAYGLRSAFVDVTYTSVTVSDHRDGAGQPITLMQVVQSGGADHAMLQRLQALVGDIERGADIADATARFHRIRRTPFMYRPGVVVLFSALLAVSVALMYRASWVVLIAVLIAALGVASAQRWLTSIRVPVFFSQVVGALVLTVITVLIAWLGRMGIEPFVDVRSGLVVSSGIVLMLAGLAVVGAAQDAIDGFSLTATGRLLDLTVMTLGVVVGILVGLQLANALGVGIEAPSEALAFGPWPYQLVGSMLIAVSVAVVHGGGGRIIVVSAVLGALGWAGSYAIMSLADLPASGGAFVGALLASFVGSLLAARVKVPSVAVTTAAIIPLVPGAMVFRGLLGVAQAGSDVEQLMIAFEALFGAAMVGIALASGATLGIFLGSPLRARLAGHRFRIRSASRPLSGAGTAPLEVVPVRTRDVPTAGSPRSKPTSGVPTRPLPEPVAEVIDGDEPPITRPFSWEDDRG